MDFTMKSRIGLRGALLTALFAVPVPAPAADLPAPASLRESPRIAAPERAPILAATRAGKRIVAVGDYGIIIYADAAGNFRQAAAVPTRAVLTSVFFLDDKRGWAVGHDGTVIASADGGATWQLLREERGKERALMSVWFENPQHGIAVGQFVLALETDDGGKTWRERRLAEGDSGDKHLLQLFTAGGGLVLIAAEAGAVFRSEDSGRNWKLIQTDNKGSFWTGAALADGALLAAGMRGHIYRSADRGVTWRELPSGTQQSLTAIVQREDGEVRLIGLAGTVLTSKDGGRSFQAGVRADRANLTATAATPSAQVLFSVSGVVAEK